ncbi:hypothetical protein [Jatrophihabitans lederbergiae]|uniref:Uncharacterized protein n=1 Tax=Jatrophihabitans lederbergiae TaxID=3075547 RepID=A0ABU2J803_9ACTN|nr:hypothetical protein [Jatrophihabitans sp. DSM 44399]MDT0261115.1 hypothetical protein [Jatrophihabitans sp. DSM 44399]
MTEIQLTRPQSARWTEPAKVRASVGRHACTQRARLTLRRVCYLARHLAR